MLGLYTIIRRSFDGHIVLTLPAAYVVIVKLAAFAWITDGRRKSKVMLEGIGNLYSYHKVRLCLVTPG